MLREGYREGDCKGRNKVERMKGGGEVKEVEKDEGRWSRMKESGEGRWRGKEGGGERRRKKEAGKRRVVGVSLQAFSVSRFGWSLLENKILLS